MDLADDPLITNVHRWGTAHHRSETQGLSVTLGSRGLVCEPWPLGW
jgi:hypothetical protein